MDKKISIVLVAMLCLSMFPWASIGVGSEAKNVKNAEPLKVDAWVESKLAKPGDTINIYAETSYTNGVSVSADIAEIHLGDFDDTEDWLSIEDWVEEQYVATISLKYNSAEEHWVGTYIIPSSAGGVYVADVTATDGTNTATDNATVHLQKFYDEHLKPVQDKAETFLYGEFNDTMNDIKENLTALNDTINAHGGIRGVVENLTGLPEWQALLDASYDIVDDYEHYYSEYLSEEFPDVQILSCLVGIYWVSGNVSNEFNFTIEEGDADKLRVELSDIHCWEDEIKVNITLTDPDGTMHLLPSFALTNESGIYLSKEFDAIPGNWTLNITTEGSVYFSLCIASGRGFNFSYNTTVPDWLDVLEVGGYCYSYDWEVEVNVTVTLTDPDNNVYTYDLSDYKDEHTISDPIPGNWTISVTTSGDGYFYLDIDGYKYERSKIACFLDNLTKFILSDEYENITSMIPELKSFIFGIPEENIIDYLLGFNLTHYLEKIDGTENIIDTCNALMSSNEYADFQDALDALQASETHWSQENLSVAIMELFMSDEMMNLLNATAEYLHDLLNETAEYLQGNDTALQNLINRSVALGGDFSQLGNLMELPEFTELINASKDDPNLGPVVDSVTTTFNNIKDRVETMINSTQLKALQASIENLQKYMENNVLYEWEHFSEDETFNYEYTVKDYWKELCVDLDPYFSGHSEFVNDTYGWAWIPGTGNMTVTLTDPDGIVYTYTKAYNGSEEKEYEMFIGFGGEETHDYTILFPTPGNWTINVTTSSDSGGGGGGGGHYDLNIGPKDEVFGSFFVGHMLKESMEELFFVFNAGIAIETEYFQTVGSAGSAKLIAYNANGRIANEEINVIVSRNTGGMAGSSGVIPAAILYVWVSGMTTADTGNGNAKDSADGEEYETEGVSTLFEVLPYIKQMMEEINPGIVYESMVTTDSNGEVTINFPVEEFGIYTIDAYFEDENRIGFGESAFIGESFVPEIGLTQIGKFAGIPVYENPNKIGENITFNVNIPYGEDATVGIGPMPLDELFPDIDMSYESSDTTMIGPGDVTLQVNGPVSIIGVVTEISSGGYTDESFTIPQFNVSFGILLTSNVSVLLDVPNILKGERSQIDVSATGTPVVTYGFAYYANGLDIMSLDVVTLSTMAYESAVYQKEYNVTDVMEQMKSMICGPGNSAFVTIPKLAVDGEYSFITFTNVGNTDIGAMFTSVNVYAEAEEIPAVISSETVDNNDIVVTYVGSGEVLIKSVTITPPEPPANVENIGIFIDVDTTGTIHNAFITIKYNDSDVSGIDESKLKMYYWNGTTEEWVLIEDSGVWTNNNTVWARITHFTIFAPMAEKTAAEPAPISWLIYVGVFSAVIIIVVISLVATVKRKKKTPPHSF